MLDKMKGDFAKRVIHKQLRRAQKDFGVTEILMDSSAEAQRFTIDVLCAHPEAVEAAVVNLLTAKEFQANVKEMLTNIRNGYGFTSDDFLDLEVAEGKLSINFNCCGDPARLQEDFTRLFSAVSEIDQEAKGY